MSKEPWSLMDALMPTSTRVPCSFLGHYNALEFASMVFFDST